MRHTRDPTSAVPHAFLLFWTSPPLPGAGQIPDSFQPPSAHQPILYHYLELGFLGYLSCSERSIPSPHLVVSKPCYYRMRHSSCLGGRSESLGPGSWTVQVGLSTISCPRQARPEGWPGRGLASVGAGPPLWVPRLRGQEA